MMITTPFFVNKLVVIGLGLIGGSLAAAFYKSKACKEVIGVVRSRKAANSALENNLVDRVVFSLADIANELIEGDIIFIAVPTLSTIDVLYSIKKYVDTQVTVTDGASVKGSVVESIKCVFGEVPERFVPGHPIVGSEKSGVSAADYSLYGNRQVILTPIDQTSPAHLKLVTDMWQSIKAEVLIMSVEEHDAVLAFTSHLPHAIAYSLVDTLANDSGNKNIFRYVAGGFEDFTRIVSSDPVMWHDIMQANNKEVLKAIDLFQNNLNKLRKAIEKRDGNYLFNTFTRAKTARDHLISFLRSKYR